MVGTVAVLATTLTLSLSLSSAKKIKFSDQREFRIEAVSYGTNHVFGTSDRWLRPFQKYWPTAFQYLLRWKHPQMCLMTETPALVLRIDASRASIDRYIYRQRNPSVVIGKRCFG